MSKENAYQPVSVLVLVSVDKFSFLLDIGGIINCGCIYIRAKTNILNESKHITFTTNEYSNLL